MSIGSVRQQDKESELKPLVENDKNSNGNHAFSGFHPIKEARSGSGDSTSNDLKINQPHPTQGLTNGVNGSELVDDVMGESCYDGYKGINALRNNEKDKARKESMIKTEFDDDQLIPGENEHKENHQEQNIKKSIEIKNGIPTRKWTNSQNANAISLANYQVSAFKDYPKSLN